MKTGTRRVIATSMLGLGILGAVYFRDAITPKLEQLLSTPRVELGYRPKEQSTAYLNKLLTHSTKKYIAQISQPRCGNCTSDEAFIKKEIKGKEDISFRVLEIQNRLERSLLRKDVTKRFGVVCNATPFYILIGENKVKYAGYLSKKDLKEFIETDDIHYKMFKERPLEISHHGRAY